MSSENRALGRTRALRHEDSFLGIEALIDDEYQDSARAETPLLLCVASRERAMEWVAEQSEASLIVLKTVLRTEDDELIPQSSPDGTAVQRVASWILDRHQVEQTTDVPRSVIADLLGMRPETLSRALHTLDEEGLIEVSRRSFLIVDPEGLRRKLPR
jgi:CRP-like cAMP-binding protein